MIMKKLMAVTLIIATGFCAKAQVYVQGGLNLANITKTNSGQTQKNNLLPTFNAGIMARFGLSDVFDLESGVLVNGHGAKSNSYLNSNNTDDNYIKTKFNPIYVEIPLNAVIKFPLNSKTKSNIFIHAGPYIAMGVAGKSSSESKLLGIVTSTSSTNIKFNNDNPTTSNNEDAAFNKLKRFDYGVNVGGGVDFGKLIIKANYGYGLAKINSTQTDNSANDKNKFRTVSISVGIPIGKL